MNCRRLAVGLLVFGAVADLTTTVIGLECTHVSELNPLAAGLMDSYGYAGLIPPTVLMLVVAIGGGWLIERWNPEPYGRYGSTAAIGLIGSMKTVVACWNSYLIVSLV